MKKVAIVAVALLAALLFDATGASSSAGPRILRFGTMAAVIRPYVGPDHPIRGVPGGGLPWQIDEANGALRANGRLRIEVEGLVLLDDDPVPPELQGTNPVPFFRGPRELRNDRPGGERRDDERLHRPVPRHDQR
jgi:hypothetical protein